jgi:hypothetical protein
MPLSVSYWGFPTLGLIVDVRKPNCGMSQQ